MSAEFSLPLRVYIEDTDAGGIVYYVNYLKFMERARTEFMRSLGYGKHYIFTKELMFVVSDARIHYRSPARLDDEILATAALTRLRGASMLFHQRVLRDGATLAEADITVACVASNSLRPQRIPLALAERLAACVHQPD
ncbi:MAG: tol-pal system-associated acyl-CoA thioesterase [Halioglobus sp.]